MSEPNDRSREQIDVDRLLERLLDIIQQQQSDLSKLKGLPGTGIPNLPENQSPPNESGSLLQVGEIAQLAPPTTFTSDAPPPESIAEIGSNLRENALFLILSGVILVIAIFIVLKPKAPEIVQLTAKAAKLEQVIRQQAEAQDQAQLSHNKEVVELQDKLRGTEAALRQNEQALIEEQAAVSALRDMAAEKIRVKQLVPKQSVADEATQLKTSIGKIANDCDSTKRALSLAREAFADNIRMLAANQLALYINLSALKSTESGGGSVVEAPKVWQDFVEPDAKLIIGQGRDTEPDIQTTLKNLPQTANIADLRRIESDAQQRLKRYVETLSDIQGRIIATQARIPLVQAEVIAAQDKLERVQRKEQKQPIHSTGAEAGAGTR